MIRLICALLIAGLAALFAIPVAILVAIPVAILAPPASAQATSQDNKGPGSDEGRYKFYRVQDTFVRLDTQTGQVAQCGHGGSGWACQLAPDERAALES